jgi:hypothetical protein
MAAEQRMRAEEIDRACDPAAGALGHDEHDALAHALTGQ